MLNQYLQQSYPLPEWIELGYSSRIKALEEVAKNPKLETIVWEATRSCNLNCLHCGTPFSDDLSGSDLTTQQIYQVFDDLHAAFDLRSLTCVSITGGEPTIRKDLPQVINHIHHLGAPQIVMHTNGHSIVKNPQLLDNLQTAGITGIGVNLDGIPERHNWIRQEAASFDLSKRALDMTVSSGLNTMVSTVVFRSNLQDLRSIRDIVLEVKPNRWRLIPLELIGRAKTLISGESLDCDAHAQMIDFILESRATYPDLPIEVGCGQWYGKTLEGLVRPYIWCCIAGLNLIGIMHDGAIGACNNIDRSYCQGNALVNDVAKVWRDGFNKYRTRTWAKTGECANCEEWGLCRGGEMHSRSPDGSRIAPCFYQWSKKRHTN